MDTTAVLGMLRHAELESLSRFRQGIQIKLKSKLEHRALF